MHWNISIYKFAKKSIMTYFIKSLTSVKKCNIYRSGTAFETFNNVQLVHKYRGLMNGPT